MINGTPWTPAEDEILRTSYAEGGIATARVALPHRTDHSITMRVCRIGAATRKPYWTPSEDRKLEDLWGDATPMWHIAKTLNRSVCAVAKRALKLGLPQGCPDGFESLSAAARRCGVTTLTMRRICKWAGVPMKLRLSETAGRKYRQHIVESFLADLAIEKWCQTEPAQSAAAKLGVCGETLRRRLAALGIQRKKGHFLRVTAAEVEAALKPIRRGHRRVHELRYA